MTLVGCTLGPKQIGDLADDTGEADSNEDSNEDSDSAITIGESEEGGADDDGDDCVAPFSSPSIDPECDAVGLSCDNDREHYNPDQSDQDQDGFADVDDHCQLTPGAVNSSDSDKDGIGNDCDRCRRPMSEYNLPEALVLDARMWPRNIPSQTDFDRDGIADVCDNCVKVANCGSFNDGNPHGVGESTPWDDLDVCQTDLDLDMIGDSCMGLEPPDDAAGPIGFFVGQDFDQDGIINVQDFCPRQPLESEFGERTSCTEDGDCPDNSICALNPAINGERYCNHGDYDGDHVGDICDTCPYSSNPMQVDDTGMQLDDEDGDFVGAECETNSSCDIRKDPRPHAFMEVSAGGMCCTTIYPGDGVYVHDMQGNWACERLCDPDGFPIMRNCTDEAQPGDVPDGSKCRLLPPVVASIPGVIELPPGCEAALDSAGLCAPSPANNFSCGGGEFEPEEINRRLTLTDLEDEDLLWSKMCSLPQWDQDLDGVGDSCDLCRFAFDPFNEPYVDDQGTLWEDQGQACNGEYADQPGALCMLAE